MQNCASYFKTRKNVSDLHTLRLIIDQIENLVNDNSLRHYGITSI